MIKNIFTKNNTTYSLKTVMGKANYYKEQFDKLKSKNTRYYYNILYSNDSKAQIYRYLRLLYLIENFQNLVNKKIISISSAIQISYLTITNQNLLYDVLKDNNFKINTIQAKKIRANQSIIDKEYIKKIILKS